jgi:hypothetical protein
LFAVRRADKNDALQMGQSDFEQREKREFVLVWFDGDKCLPQALVLKIMV